MGMRVTQETHPLANSKQEKTVSNDGPYYDAFEIDMMIPPLPAVTMTESPAASLRIASAVTPEGWPPCCVMA